MAIDLRNVATEQLKQVIELREKIDALQNELDQLLGEEAPPISRKPAKPAKPAGKRVLSPAAKASIAAAQKKRWAAHRRNKAKNAPEKAEAKPKAKTKRTMSPDAKAKIAAAQREIWARRRAMAV